MYPSSLYSLYSHSLSLHLSIHFHLFLLHSPISWPIHVAHNMTSYSTRKQARSFELKLERGRGSMGQPSCLARIGHRPYIRELMKGLIDWLGVDIPTPPEGLTGGLQSPFPSLRHPCNLFRCTSSSQVRWIREALHTRQLSTILNYMATSKESVPIRGRKWKGRSHLHPKTFENSWPNKGEMTQSVEMRIDMRVPSFSIIHPIPFPSFPLFLSSLLQNASSLRWRCSSSR